MGPRLLDYFSTMTDPRVERTKLHKLEDILAIAICATICGAEGWYEMAFFGQCKQQWFETFLELSNGIPTDDTFRRVISALQPDEFEACFQRWTKSVSNHQSDIIAIDGKTLRRSHDNANGKSAVHIVSAWACENKLHWSLDVSFGEDDCRIRKGFGAENVSRLRRIALNLLKQEKTAKCGIKSKRHKAGWDEKYLQKIVGI